MVHDTVCNSVPKWNKERFKKWEDMRVIRRNHPPRENENMKKIFAPKNVRARLRSLFTLAALLAFNVTPVFAQSTTFNSTDLKTGISNSLAVIMMFGFVLGISAVIYGGFAIRRGDVDQGKMSIIGGAIIAAAPAAVFAFYKIFGLDSNSAVGVGSF